MEFAAFILLIALSLIGLGAIFFTTFGTFIIMAGAVAFGWMTEFQILDPQTLVLIFILYLFGEFFEYLAVIFGVKKLGASNAAVIGAILGGIFGAFLGVAFFGIGIIPGTLLGIFFGAFLFEWLIHNNVETALKAGIGGVLGRVASVMVKLVIALIIFAMIAFKIMHSPLYQI